MKCPKCGYNSFEYLDSCKKCNADLAGFKASHGIRAMLLPLSQAIHSHAVADGDILPLHGEAEETAGADDGMFSWHDPSMPMAAGSGGELAPGSTPDPDPDPFSFDFDLPEAAPVGVQEEPFSELSLDDLAAGDLVPSTLEQPPPEREPVPAPEEVFGDFSFDDLYQEEPSPVGGAPEAPELETTDDFLATTGRFASETEPPPSAGIPPAALEAPAAAFTPPEPPPPSFDLDEFGFDEPAPESAPQDGGEVDSLGLSPEEFESLFGEPPPKKKST